jgi:hypothetical protein
MFSTPKKEELIGIIRFVYLVKVSSQKYRSYCQLDPVCSVDTYLKLLVSNTLQFYNNSKTRNQKILTKSNDCLILVQSVQPGFKFFKPWGSISCDLNLN